MAGTTRTHFRALARENVIPLSELWEDFWRGDFERDGKTILRYQHLPATREMLIRLGAPAAAGADYCRDRKKLLQLIAANPYGDVDRNFREKIFEELDGGETFVERFLVRRQDQIAKQIGRVLDRAASIKRRKQKLSNRAIVEELASSPSKYAGFSPETLRKIISGTYPPARRRGIPGLRLWMGET
jgi:hypothetical protein